MQDAIRLHGAKVIVGDGRVIDQAQVVVANGRILAVDPMGLTNSAHTDDTVDIDLSGKVIMPALINPHGHIGYLRDGVCHADNYDRDNILDHLRRLAYYGVSTFMSLGTERQGLEVAIRQDQASGRLDTGQMAQLLTASRGITAAPRPGEVNAGAFFARDVLLEVAGPDEATAAVETLAKVRPDVIKVWVDDREGTALVPDAATVTAVVEAARRHQIPVIAHVYDLDDATKAVTAGVAGLAHLVRAEAPGPALVQQMKSAGVVAFSSIGIHRNYLDDTSWLDEPWVRETVSTAERQRVRAYFAAMSADERSAVSDVLPVLRNEVVTLHSAGVPVILSCDTGLDGQFFGIAEHRELEALVLAGMSPLDAISAATSLPASLLGLTDRGLVAPERRADLLILDDDPLVDIRHTRAIHEVLLAGRPLDRAAMRAQWSPPPSTHHDASIAGAPSGE